MYTSRTSNLIQNAFYLIGSYQMQAN